MRRLQVAGREHDLVLQRVVERVDGLRRKRPFLLVDRLAELAGLVGVLVLARADHVADEVVGADGEGGVVAPLVRIADLLGERSELGDRRLLGRVTHPAEDADPLAKNSLHVPDHLECARLCRRREVLLYVSLAKRIAKTEVSGPRAALVPRQKLLCARQRFLEREVLVHELRAQDWSGVLDDLPPKIGLPVGDRSVRDETVHGREEFRVLHIDGGNVLVAEVLEVFVPVPVRRHRLELRRRPIVVVQLRIAKLHSRAGRARERGLERHDALRIGCRLRSRCSAQGEHALDVSDVILTDLLRSSISLEIVIPVRKSEPALKRAADHGGAVLRVLSRPETEQHGHAFLLQLGYFLRNVVSVVDVIDFVENVFERLCPGPISGRRIHAVAVVGAEHLIGRRLVAGG